MFLASVPPLKVDKQINACAQPQDLHFFLKNDKGCLVFLLSFFFFSHDNLKERLLTDEHTKGKEALVPFGRVLQKPYDKYAKPLSNPASRLFGIVKCVKAMFTLPVTPEYRGHGGGWQYNKMRVLTTLRNQAETCNQD